MNPDLVLGQPVVAVIDPVRVGVGEVFFFIANEANGCVVVLRKKLDNVLKARG